MIEINLLPGARKKARRTGPSVNFAEVFKDLGSRIRDPWLISAVVGVTVGVLAIGGMWTYQSRRESALTEREQKAVQDSTRYASVIAERNKAEAQRDSVRRQIAVISAIDGTRLIWPHIMDEISRALPPYVWLRSIVQTTLVSTDPPEVQAGVVKPKDKKPAPGAAAGAAPTDDSELSLQVDGNTVDIQALTLFMKQLEASQFLKNVTLVRSDVVTIGGKDVTQFRLDIKYQKPDPSALRTVPFTVSVR